MLRASAYWGNWGGCWVIGVVVKKRLKPHCCAQDLAAERPPFPPPSLALSPAFPQPLGAAAGSELLSTWALCRDFRQPLRLPSFSVDTLLAALSRGSASPLLAGLHVALLRTLIADTEEAAFASATMQVGGRGKVWPHRAGRCH